MRTITVTHELGFRDLLALRRADGSEDTMQEIVERLTRAVVAQAIAKGMKGIEADYRIALGDLHIGRANEAVLVGSTPEGETPR